MQQNDNASLIYGLVLLTFLLVSFYTRKKYHNEPIFTYAAVWVGVFAVLAIGYTMKENIMQNILSSRVVSEDGQLTVKKSNDGHFYIDAYLNNKKVHFLVDTGASSAVLKPSDAKKVGIDLSTLKFTQRYSTANGLVDGAVARVTSFKIGDVEFSDVSISVTTGELEVSLLGMNVLENFASYRFEGDVLYLTP